MLKMVITYRFKYFEHAFSDDSIFRCFDTTKGMNLAKILEEGIGGRGWSQVRGRNGIRLGQDWAELGDKNERSSVRLTLNLARYALGLSKAVKMKENNAMRNLPCVSGSANSAFA